VPSACSAVEGLEILTAAIAEISDEYAETLAENLLREQIRSADFFAPNTIARSIPPSSEDDHPHAAISKFLNACRTPRPHVPPGGIRFPAQIAPRSLPQNHSPRQTVLRHTGAPSADARTISRIPNCRIRALYSQVLILRALEHSMFPASLRLTASDSDVERRCHLRVQWE
jgi:hypothetical protein